MSKRPKSLPNIHIGPKRAGCGRAGQNAILTMVPESVTCEDCKKSRNFVYAIKLRDPDYVESIAQRNERLAGLYGILSALT
jgi:hypothetical protein